MNAFKKKIIKMKQKERIKAIRKLSIVNNKKNKGLLKEMRNRKSKKRHIDNRIQDHIENEVQQHFESNSNDR